MSGGIAKWRRRKLPNSITRRARTVDLGRNRIAGAPRDKHFTKIVFLALRDAKKPRSLGCRKAAKRPRADLRRSIPWVGSREVLLL